MSMYTIGDCHKDSPIREVREEHHMLLHESITMLSAQNWEARQKIGALEQEVERLKLEVEWLQTPMRKRHEDLLQAAKDHLDVAGCFESEPLCEAIDACERNGP